MKITKASHLDHGLTRDQIAYLERRFADVKPSPPTATIIIGVVLPPELGEVPCSLYGPIMGDENVPESAVHYAPRGDRKYDSRLVKRPARMQSKVTVIMGPHEGEPCILYTAFGGPLAPKEVNDPDNKSPEPLATFWANHALAEPTK